MTQLVDFGVVKAELTGASFMRVMRVLQRSRVFGSPDNVPSVLVLTDQCIYFGGTETSERKFHKILMSDVLDVGFSGTSFWRCVKVTYSREKKQKSVFLCPFDGEPHKPEINVEEMNELHELIKKYSRLKDDSPQ